MAGSTIMQLDDIEDVLEDVRAGKPIVLIDDVDRENEGDLTLAAECVTPESLSFMMIHGKGLICISLPQARLKELGIPMQPLENTSAFGTNFAVSFDHRSVGATGITADGRARTILAAVDEKAQAQDFVMPGYVFPVAAVPGGVLKRRGQTEGSVDLSALAGLKPAGVICEIMAADGRMLRGAELEEYCRFHNLKLTSIEEIVQYRLRQEVSIRRVAELPVTKEMELGRLTGQEGAASEDGFRIVVYVDDVDGNEHFALVKGDPRENALVRIHSECLTGDVFHSARCDCGYQFDTGLQAVNAEGEGVIIYLHQEGRGIGLANKLRAYELQDKGVDTVDANVLLGFQPDEREYRVAAQILDDLGIGSVRLITHNPQKLEALKSFGIKVSERVELPVRIDKFNKDYMETKQRRMGHLFEG